jgi:hypothetical protein
MHARTQSIQTELRTVHSVLLYDDYGWNSAAFVMSYTVSNIISVAGKPLALLNISGLFM